MMRRGECYPLKTAAHRTGETGCGSSQKMWLTPTVTEIMPRSMDGWEKKRQKREAGGHHSLPMGTLQEQVVMTGDRKRPVTDAREVLKWPTPCAQEWKHGPNETGRGTKHQMMLANKVYAMEKGKYPTPRTSGMCGGSGAWEQMGKLVRDGKMTEEERHSIGAGNGGKLNPDWVEWLMGWPIGWTDLKPLATGKFRLWLRGRFPNFTTN